MTVAALFVDGAGVYSTLPEVDCWDEARDARLYAGPHAVVAHPPCGRWCQLAGLVEKRYGYKRGDDGGCFKAALEAVRRWGGVLEHPAWTLAWPAFGLPAPPTFGWQQSIDGSWVCEVSQAAYGHEARKLTWLFYVGVTPPAICRWARPKRRKAVSGCRNHGLADVERLSSREAAATPPPFAQFLVGLARASRASEAA